MKAQEQRDSRPERGQRQLLLRYSGMGFELAAAIVGLTLVGLWVDYRWKCGPAGVLVGAGLGIVGGLYNFMRQALRLGRQSRDERRHGVTPQDDERPSQS